MRVLSAMRLYLVGLWSLIVPFWLLLTVAEVIFGGVPNLRFGIDRGAMMVAVLPTAMMVGAQKASIDAYMARLPLPRSTSLGLHFRSIELLIGVATVMVVLARAAGAADALYALAASYVPVMPAPNEVTVPLLRPLFPACALFGLWLFAYLRTRLRAMEGRMTFPMWSSTAAIAVVIALTDIARRGLSQGDVDLHGAGAAAWSAAAGLAAVALVLRSLTGRAFESTEVYA